MTTQQTGEPPCRQCQEAMQEGLVRGTARSLIDVYNARFGAMPERIHGVIERTHDEPTLRKWLRFASTLAARELTAIIDGYDAPRATREFMKAWRQEALQEGIHQGQEQGMERGTARSLIDVYEARFGAMPEDVRAVVDDTHDPATLRSWVKLTATRAPDELAAAIRALPRQRTDS